MQNLTEMAKNVEHLVRANSPAILTGFGVAGVVSTALLSVKATFKAADDIVDEYYKIMQTDETDDHSVYISDALKHVPFKDQVRVSWKRYIPPAATGAVSIACIIGSNRISSNRAAALVTAYSLTERAFADYKDKVVEQFGNAKEQKVRDAVAQDKVTEAPPVRDLIINDDTEVVCYDTMSGRYFKSSAEKIRRAENHVNKEILDQGYAAMNEFFRELDVEPTGYGEEVGWNLDNMLDVQFSSVLTPDKKPVLAIGFQKTPIVDYYRFR
jgi:hypothetical protein